MPLSIRPWPGEEDKVILVSKQLELDTVPEPTHSRLGFIIIFSEFLSMKMNSSFPRQGERGERKTNRRALGINLTSVVQATLTSDWCILIFAPKVIQRGKMKRKTDFARDGDTRRERWPGIRTCLRLFARPLQFDAGRSVW